MYYDLEYYQNIADRFNVPALVILYEEINYVLFDKYFLFSEIDSVINQIHNAQISIAKMFIEAVKKGDIDIAGLKSYFDRYYELIHHEKYYYQIIQYLPNNYGTSLPIRYLYFIALENDLQNISYIIDNTIEIDEENSLLRHIIKFQADYHNAYLYMREEEMIIENQRKYQTATSRNARFAAIIKHQKTNQKKNDVIHHFLQEQANSNISKNQFAKKYAKSYCQSEVTLRKWLKGDLSDPYDYAC